IEPARQQFAGARCRDNVGRAIAPLLCAFGIERNEEVQPLAGVCVGDGKQRGIGDVQVRLIERDLDQVIEVFPSEAVAFDLTIARGLQAFVFPYEWINHIGAGQVRTMNDDAITVAAQRTFDCGELTRLRRPEPETRCNKMPACTLFEIMAAIENLACPGRELGFYPPIKLNAAQAIMPDDRGAKIGTWELRRSRRGALDRGVDRGIDRFKREGGAVQIEHG